MISDDPVGHNPSVALVPKSGGASTFVKKRPWPNLCLRAPLAGDRLNYTVCGVRREAGMEVFTLTCCKGMIARSVKGPPCAWSCPPHRPGGSITYFFGKEETQ